MKNRFKITGFAIVLMLLPAFLSAQNFSTVKVLEKSVPVQGAPRVKMSNYSADLDIKTSGTSSISIKTEVKIEGGSSEDVAKFLKAIESFKFELEGSMLQIDTRFYKSMNSNGIRSTITLLNGDKIEIKKYEIRHTLIIPKSTALELDNKYGEINLEDLGGAANLTLYSSTLHAGNFSVPASFNAKYSKIFMGHLEHVKFDLYDSDVMLKQCGDIQVTSKYSKFEAEKTGSMKIDSYDDDYSVRSAQGINAEAKYSDFEFTAGLMVVQLNLYDSNFKTTDLSACSYSGKYSELVLGNVNDLKIIDSYDDSFKAAKVGKAAVATSKYSDYIFNEASAFSLSGYDDNISLASLGTGDGEINVTGKYTKLNITAGATPFQLDFKIQYPKIDLPDNLAISQKILEHDNLTLIANKTGKKIIVNGYDMTVDIK